MGATNHTTNYNLPQFVGSDKPTWLGDINGAMSAIDTQMKANDTLANTAKSTADTASETAGTALTNANTADGKAVDAQSTATSALNKSLANEAKLENLFNFSTVITPSTGDYITDGISVTASTLKIVKNPDESIFKIYGSIGCNFTKNQTVTLTINNVFSNVADTYNIDNCGFCFQGGNLNRCVMSINQNGSITISVFISNTQSGLMLLYPCLYFNQDFGD